MAEKRAAFCLRRFRALGFSNRRRRRIWSMVCSRSSFFLSRRMALSTGSPFRSLISDIAKAQFVTHEILTRLLFLFRLQAQAFAPDFAFGDFSSFADRLGDRST